MKTPFSDGYQEGLRGERADTRYCEWESTTHINEWLRGYDAGQADARRQK